VTTLLKAGVGPLAGISALAPTAERAARRRCRDRCMRWMLHCGGDEVVIPGQDLHPRAELAQAADNLRIMGMMPWVAEAEALRETAR
jgi:hypothetical protein